MGKRQQRYQQPNIEDYATKIVSKMCHILLNTNQVFSGIMLSIDKNTILLQVTGSKKISLATAQVIEVITDYQA